MSGKGFRHLIGVFVSDEIGGLWRERFIRPVRTWSMALDQFCRGVNPLGFHLSDILIHSATALVIFRLVLQLGGLPLPALAASLFSCFILSMSRSSLGTALGDESLSAASLLAALFLYLRAGGAFLKRSAPLSCARDWRGGPTVLTRRAWREEAWESYAARFAGHPVLVLVWNPESFRMEIKRPPAARCSPARSPV